jgi:hypothetical protein
MVALPDVVGCPDCGALMLSIVQVCPKCLKLRPSFQRAVDEEAQRTGTPHEELLASYLNHHAEPLTVNDQVNAAHHLAGAYVADGWSPMERQGGRILLRKDPEDPIGLPGILYLPVMLVTALLGRTSLVDLSVSSTGMVQLIETTERYRNHDKGIRNAQMGFVIALIGTIVTIATYSSADPGGTYIVAWGAIVFGGMQMLAGMALARR